MKYTGPSKQTAPLKRGDGTSNTNPSTDARRRIRVHTPIATPARMRRRHWGLVASFLLLVIAPLAVMAYYLTQVAVPQYASTTGFTVRQNDAGGGGAMMDGLAAFTSGSGQADTDILFEYILSQELVRRVDARLDIVAHYAAPHGRDPVFALAPDASIEEILDYWQRIVRVGYGRSNGLIELRVLAFEPEMARDIAQAILEESQLLVNALNSAARADLIRFARTDRDAALARLRIAQEAVTLFRTRSQIVDLERDLQGRMGVLDNLQQQLAEALIAYDLLSANSGNSEDSAVQQLGQRIDVIRARIAQERENFTLSDVAAGGADYPSLMAEFERLMVDREFAEENYRTALTALDIARVSEARQSRYLAVFIQPTLSESTGFPRADVILGLTGLFLVLGWSILALVFYSIRDRQ